MESIITTHDLQFYFGKMQVLENLNLDVPRGSIYGFLGPNGAGKTTTIRLLLGLLNSEKGKIRVFGKDIRKNRIEILEKTGSLIENPSIYKQLSGRDNLRVSAKARGVDPKRIDEVLEITDLTKNADRRSGQYSLGMCQRLGIAQALLSNPELLILDEPSNGLDPNGIIDIRNLIRSLSADHGKTIFVSSHNLAEVEKTVTHLGIIEKGKMKFQGTLKELNRLNTPFLQIHTDRNQEAASLLYSLGYELVADGHDGIKVKVESAEEAAKLNRILVLQDFEVYSLSKSNQDLEHMFLELTGNETLDIRH
jgi:lantibiotic transport system ATP-binding protein